MRSKRRERWRGRMLAVAVVAALGLSFGSGPARAQFDLLGLLGLRGEETPEPSLEALPYEVDIVYVGEDPDLEAAFETASNLIRLRGEPPPDAETLARRAQADLVPFIDALWGAGYYNARVTIEVAGVPLTLRGENLQAAAAAARPFRGTALVPIRIVVETGPQFTIRALRLIGPDGAPLAVPEDAFPLGPGDPATSASILGAQANLVDYYRAQSRPFAEVVDVDPVVDHPSAAMDLTVRVEPGPVAGIGPIAVSGAPNIREPVIRSFIYTEPGDPYSPRALADIRRAIQRIEAVSAVRVNEADALDAAGNLPLEVVVSERLPRVFGVAARWSTTEGPEASISWTHRNLFGGAERLRLEASVFYLARDGGRPDLRRQWTDELGGRASVSFLKPALWGTRNDFVFDAAIARTRTDGYTADFGNVVAGIRHRFSDRFNVQAGIEYERGTARDVLGRIDYQLVGFPLALELDTTLDRLDPREGFRLRAGVTPFVSALGSDPGFTLARADASAYFPLDARQRFVLAGRLGIGSIVGAELTEIPPNRRFFAGGGGSVRGYEFRSLGPRVAGQPIGGRSLIEGSLEARLRVTDTIGIVPFVDAGMAFAQSYPSFDETVRWAAGLGLRYHTPIGPLRLDVAFPLNPGRGDNRYAIYIGIGQAF